MTRPATPTHVEYIADGSTTAYTYPFKVDFSNEVEVRDNGALMTIDSMYTLTGVGAPTGGSVSFFNAPLKNHIISVRLAVLFEQLLDLIPNGAFPAEAIEFRFDQLVKMVQQLSEEIGRRPQYPIGSRATVRDLILPEFGYGKLLGYGSTDEIILYDATIRQIIPDSVSGMAFGKSSAVLNASDGANSIVAVSLVPIGVRLKAVTYRCIVSFGTSHGLSSVAVGGLGIADRWASNAGIVATNITDASLFGPDDQPITKVPVDVVVSANGGAFDATGSCIVTAHYETYVPDTSV